MKTKRSTSTGTFGVWANKLFSTCFIPVDLKYGFISPVQLLNNQEEDVKKKNDTENRKNLTPIFL